MNYKQPLRPYLTGPTGVGRGDSSSAKEGPAWVGWDGQQIEFPDNKLYSIYAQKNMPGHTRFTVGE